MLKDAIVTFKFEIGFLLKKDGPAITARCGSSSCAVDAPKNAGMASPISRGVRWDSDHVVTFNDDLQAITQEIVRNDALERIHIGHGLL